MCVCAKSLQSCAFLGDPIAPPWDSPGKNTGVGGRAPLQGIFPNQGLSPQFHAVSVVPALQADPLPLGHQGSFCSP